MPSLVGGKVEGGEALRAASLAGDDAKAQALLDAGTLADEPDRSDGDRTALHIASRAGHLKVEHDITFITASYIPFQVSYNLNVVNSQTALLFRQGEKHDPIHKRC
jgi:ankyrin repeat protein